MVALKPERASPRLARGVGAVVALAAVALTLFAAVKHLSMGGLASAEVDRGEASLARYIAGEEAAAGVAQEAFADAASVSIVDHYPAFGIAVTRRMQKLRGGAEPNEPGDAVLNAMLDLDWERARTEVDRMRDTSPDRAEYYDRLVESVRQSATNSE
jgi:hypothetical protein